MIDSSFTIHDPGILHPPGLDEISDPFLESTAELENCARALDLEDWILLRLKQFEQETTVHTVFPSAGKTAHPLTALWVRHSTVRGSPIVPISISGEAFLNSVRVKAMRTTWTAALYGLDTGGGAAAIILDPNRCTEEDLREAVLRVGQSISELSGSSVVIPDAINPTEMEWLNAALRSSGNTQTRVSGMTCFYEERTTKNEEPSSYGLSELVRCAAGHLHGTRVAIQGFDPACQSLAHLLRRSGAHVVAVADPSGAVYDPLGLDPPALIAYTRDHEMLLGFPAAEAIVNADLLEADCDVLVLASGVRQVASHNASRIRARFILEAVPHAITQGAKAELSAAGKIVVSDLVCGGVRLLHYATEPERTTFAVRPQPWLRRRIRHTWSEIQSAAAKWQVPTHQAADLLAINRLAEVLRARGV